MRWFKKKRIIVPFDYSDDSLHAVRVGMSLAENEEHVHVVHVLYDPPPSEAGFHWDPSRNEARKLAARQAIEEKLLNANIRDIKIDVLIGDPAREIVNLAKAIDTDLIVIPSHGYTGLERILLGSVTQHVVRHAKCPVLVLKDY